MNYIWALLIVISVIVATFTGNLSKMVQAMFDGAEQAVKLSLYLVGIMSFWLGMMKIADSAGITNFLARVLKPVAKFIFPEISKNDKAISAITMNIAANAMGLSNAATPMGIKAMEEMQKDNPKKNTATNSMCTFLAMNTAGFQLVPATVIAVLAANGAKNPTAIILPTLIVTTITFGLALVIVKSLEKLSSSLNSEQSR